MRYLFFTIFILAQYVATCQCVGEPNQLTWQQWENVHDRKINELLAHPDYPLNPNQQMKLFRTKSPVNFDNFMGGRILGYISVAETTTVSFNITGNEVVDFYLSSSTQQQDTALVAYISAYTELEEHDKYPSQTSSPIVLQGGQHYYFELQYAEKHGGDHATLFWKNPNVDALNWQVITEEYLYDVDCLDSCPQSGTPCDDGNHATLNDIQDGYCNCIGTPVSSNSCIGERGLMQAYVYEDIPGSNLNSLFNAPNYPAVPNTSEVLNMLGKRFAPEPDSSGSLVQAYLTVPVSGMYNFAITGDNQTRLYISSDDSPANKGNTMIQTAGATLMTDYYVNDSQVSGEIHLEQGQYYYIELVNKQAAGWYHYRTFWQTPFTDDDQWKSIPLIYLYDYNCEIACVPEQTLCNDGDPHTSNDIYNEDCECIGSPCTSPDCDSELGNYIPYDKCDLSGELLNLEENNWLSCDRSSSPSPDYNKHIWIQYDLGDRYKIFDSHIWNYNVAGETSKGFKEVSILYSEDGVNYTELTQDIWPYASGNNDYTGFAGPDFMGVYARYILFVSLEKSGCQGIGKVSFNVVKCPLQGTTCNDNDNLTIDDKYDDDCNCIGRSIEENACDQDYLVLGDSTLHTAIHSANIQVSSISKIAKGNIVGLVGGSSVLLEPGFDSGDSLILVVNIDPCDSDRPDTLAIQMSEIEQYQADLAEAKKDRLKLSPMDDSDIVEIQYYVSTPSMGKLHIKYNNEIVATLVEREHSKKGIYLKRIRTKKLIPGVYSVTWQTDSENEIRRLVVE